MKHVASLTKHKRGPFLDLQWSLACTCGTTGPPTDIDDARTQIKRHIQNVEAERLASASRDQHKKESAK